MDKNAVRRTVLARRAAVPASVRAARDCEIARHVRALVTPGLVVCAYVPDDDEAGGPGLPETLLRSGAQVLLPVSPATGPLEWAAYSGPADMVRGRFGILIPSTTPGPPERVAEAEIVLVPAVAVDRAGNRLGRGGGYCDRSLALTGPRTRVLSLLDSENVLDHVPAEPHDRPVHGVITPDGLLDFGTWHSQE